MSDQTFGKEARKAWDEMHRSQPVERYSVWWSTGKHDGSKSFDSLAAAQEEYDDQCARDRVVEVELQDNSNDNDPIVLKAKRPE